MHNSAEKLKHLYAARDITINDMRLAQRLGFKEQARKLRKQAQMYENKIIQERNKEFRSIK